MSAKVENSGGHLRFESKSMGYVYIFLTIMFTVYGQLALRWHMTQVGALPPGTEDKVWFILKQFKSLWVLSSFSAAFIASLFWMATLTKFELSFAYPYMSLCFVVVMALSILFFGEVFTWNKIVGTVIIVAGLYIVTR